MAKLTHAASIEKILECAYLRPKKPVFAPGAKKGAFIDSAPIVRLRARKRPKRADLRTSARTGAKVPHARIWPRTKRLPRTGPKVPHGGPAKGAPGPPDKSRPGCEMDPGKNPPGGIGRKRSQDRRRQDRPRTTKQSKKVIIISCTFVRI